MITLLQASDQKQGCVIRTNMKWSKSFRPRVDSFPINTQPKVLSLLYRINILFLNDVESLWEVISC